MSFSEIKNLVDEKINQVEEVVTTVNSVVSTVQSLASGATANESSANNVEESAEPGPMKSTKADPGTLIPGTTAPPWPNELEPLASYNCIFTLSILTTDEINNSTFRTNPPQHNILRSGGGITKDQTAVEAAFGINTEFFIDDIEIESVISASGAIGNTNAAKIDFTVLEPYSMGLFAETIRITAQKAGYKNHLGIPFLLTVEFPGWDENNNNGRASYSKRMIPINIANMEFDVTASGSVYSVTAVPWNEISLGDDKQKLLVDTVIKGRTVSELLQTGLESLASSLNTREINKEEAEQLALGDQYIIMFPKREKSAESPGLGEADEGQSATIADQAAGVQDDAELYRSASNVEDDSIPSAFDAYKASVTGKINARSKIGEAIRGYAENSENINYLGDFKIIEEWLTKGSHPMGKEGFAYENGIYKRGNVELQLSDDLRTFTFTQGTRIQDIIEEVILASGYAKELDAQLKSPPADGFIDYFKIETQTYLIDNTENLKYTGKYPKVHVYRVVPYKAHVNIFKAPTSATPGIRELKALCAKEYNYIYTGKNTDVLEFDIKFNGFYQMNMPATNGSNTYRKGGSDQIIQGEAPEVPAVNPGTTDSIPDEGAIPVGEETNPGTGNAGGSSSESIETSVARFFNKTLLNNEAFLTKINLKIMGDPYFISDSGIGNYNAGDTSISGADKNFNMNRDGAMNYQNGQVHINVIFRTPIDYNPDGGMLFPDSTKLVYAFSGVYQVVKVVSSFNKGQFTQDLECIRVLGQTADEPQSLVKAGDPENAIVKPPGGVFDSDRNIIGIDPSAIDKLIGSIPGGRLAATLDAAESAIRDLIGGLDPLTASANELANALGIDPSLITGDILNQIQDGISIDNIPGLPDLPGFPPNINLNSTIADLSQQLGIPEDLISDDILQQIEAGLPIDDIDLGINNPFG